ncbi:4'-phosphopantetheinyl transferase superfamily protein [Acinetobacter sp. EC24]|nr:4'-phosphopantetheinyl transferase superfamily protein [Acinetobacter rathckeae]MBF7687986.1 4'-phosphopantetheinyl transferase superfamily protein [Acinetobacter rathckeae]MBF7695960.1 4'-phosphopantetheinyl transferase superfamily protein [Acinetobacter rathckeae]
MIYLMYKKITDILCIEDTGNLRLNTQQRMQLQDYRNKQLQQQLTQPLKIEINTFGKPISSQMSFNHSHSQRYYALAYSQSVLNVGVDIEDFSRNVRMKALAEHCFHEEELLMWKKLGEDRTFWFQVWTIKEAVLKAHSLGIRLNLKTLNTQAHPENLEGIVDHEKIGRFYYQSLKLEESMLTVASDKKFEIQWI